MSTTSNGLPTYPFTLSPLPPALYPSSCSSDNGALRSPQPIVDQDVMKKIVASLSTSANHALSTHSYKKILSPNLNSTAYAFPPLAYDLQSVDDDDHDEYLTSPNTSSSTPSWNTYTPNSSTSASMLTSSISSPLALDSSRSNSSSFQEILAGKIKEINISTPVKPSKKRLRENSGANKIRRVESQSSNISTMSAGATPSYSPPNYSSSASIASHDVSQAMNDGQKKKCKISEDEVCREEYFNSRSFYASMIDIFNQYNASIYPGSIIPPQENDKNSPIRRLNDKRACISEIFMNMFAQNLVLKNQLMLYNTIIREL